MNRLYQVTVGFIRRINPSNKMLSLPAFTLLLPVLALLFTSSAFAIFGTFHYVGPVPNMGTKNGYVMARAVVTDSAGQPTLVKYNSDGSEAGVVSVGGNYEVSELSIIAAAAYHAEAKRLEAYEVQYKNTLAKGATLMSRDAFLAASFTAADNKTPITTPVLAKQYNSVLVRGQSDRLSLDPNQLVLMGFSFDMTTTEVSDSAIALVVSPTGNVLAESSLNIGYRSGFFGNPSEAQSGKSWGSVDNDETVFGPVVAVKANVDEFAYVGGAATTDSNGKYAFMFMMPICPVGGFEFKTDVWSELHYINLLPMGSPYQSYHLRTPGYTYCFADLVPTLLVAEVTSILAGIATPIYQSNLYADVMFLTGNMYMLDQKGGIVPMGETTHTSFEEEASDKLQRFYDFNGDGQADKVFAGNLVTQQNDAGEDEEVFQASSDGKGDLQGLYFDTPEAGDEPDLLRVMDQAIRTESVGLLDTISQEDLRNTDVLFFRESTGQLIMERKGLKEAEVRRGDVMLDEEDQLISYRVMLRGPRDWNLNIGGAIDRSGSYSEWATEYQLTEPFQDKESDHIRPGETIKVVAINRATGYMGTARVPLNRTFEWDLTVLAPTITLRPPNLKVWAERKYDVEHGLTKGDEKTYTIGTEGAALTSDTTITIYTEWLDEYGSPLPDELGLDNGEQYGFTGRLAKVVGENQLQGAGAGNDLASFAIAPGRRTQVINVGSNLTTAEHYYVHVIGKAKDQECVGSGSCPSFTDLGFTAPYDSRPNLLVPFMVPLPDEDASWQEYNKYRELLADETVTEKPNKPLPAYTWAYRPEYQFSQYGLEMQAINTASTDANSAEQSSNIFNSANPTVSSSDDYITALYSLISSNNDRLTAIDGPQELVLALGQEEQLITIGEDQSITFSNIDHLSSLDPEDFLSMRLYTNNDASNILWEYAFQQMSLFPERNNDIANEDNIIEVTADEAFASPQSVNAFILGAKEGDVQSVSWSVEGEGSLSSSGSSSADGVFSTLLTLSTQVDDTATVAAEITGSKQPSYSVTYKITPGLANDIELTQATGKTAIGGLGKVNWTVKVTDAFGNNVKDGTALLVNSPALDLSKTTTTLDGVATLTFIGVSKAGSHPVTISVDNAELIDSVSVSDITLEYTNLANIATSQSKIINIKATSDYGDLSGLEMDIATHRGSVSQTRVAFNAGGEASVNYHSGKYRGFAQLSAKVVGTHSLVTQDFNVVDEDDYFDSNVLLTEGSSTIDFGNGATVSYGTSTDLHIKTTAEDEVEASLANIFEPPLYPLQDYSTDLGIGVDNAVIDYSSGIDGSSANVALSDTSLKKFSRSWELKRQSGEDAYISIPENTRTSNLENAGINFRIKIPDISNVTTDTILMNWDDFGLKLQLNTDHTLSLIMMQDNGQQVVSHPKVMVSGQWHHIAAHLYKDELKLGIDEQIAKVDVTQPIKAENLESYALKIALTTEEVNLVKITDLKVYDWLGEAKITFDSGDFEQTSIADTHGNASLGVTAKPALFAYTRAYQTKTLYAQLGDAILPNAYATNTTCQSAQDPIDPASDDAAIRTAEQYMEMLLECFVKPKVEEARINYETSSGFKEASIALFQRESLEVVYSKLKSMKNYSVIVVNCLDAALTGSNSSAVGAGCDFITSVLAIGDLRDILIQSWHYNIGDTNEYDELTAQLAAVGLVASGAQLIPGVGQTLGVVVTTFVAAGKTVAKTFKKIGPAGVVAGKLLGSKIGDIATDPSLSVTQKVKKFELMLPLVEIGASFALIYSEQPKIFKFLGNTLSSGNNIDNMITWTGRYVKRLEGEFTASSKRYYQEEFIALFVSDAYAAGFSEPIRAKFVVQINKLLGSFDDLAIDTSTEAGMKFAAGKFNEALDELLNNLDNVNYKLKDVADDMDVIRAFVNVGQLTADGAKDRIRKFANNSGYTIGYGKDLMSSEEFISAFADIPAHKLNDQSKKAVAGLINTFQNDGLGFNITKGNIAHVLMITDILKRSDIEILAVEKIADQLTTARDVIFKGRRYDIVVKENGKVVFLEVKNISNNTLQSTLSKGMALKQTAKNKSDDAVEEIGQLYQDIVSYIKNDYSGHQWVFTPDVMPSINDNFVAYEDVIIKDIKNLINKHQNRFAAEFGLDLKKAADKEKWGRRVEALEDAMDGVDVNGVKFVQIYPFSNTIKKTN